MKKALLFLMICISMLSVNSQDITDRTSLGLSTDHIGETYSKVMNSYDGLILLESIISKVESSEGPTTQDNVSLQSEGTGTIHYSVVYKTGYTMFVRIHFENYICNCIITFIYI